MFNKFFLFGLRSFFVLLISSISPAQTNSLVLFEDDFESYTAGAQLACQDSIHWNTWSSIPCDWLEDPFVSNSKAHSGSNSVWIQPYNDLIKTFPNYTTGKYSIEFHLYIPSGYTASWCQLAVFINSDSTEWGFYAMFDPFGNGNIAAGEWGAAQFSFSYDTWMHNELIVDLNSDWAEYYFEGNRIHSWQWTLGSVGDTIPLQLSVTNIMGFDFPNPPDSSQWYMDDYKLVRIDTTVGIKDFSVPTEYKLYQNFPNPFNPTTTIKYQIPEMSFVSLKVYDVLGNEIVTLINEEKPIGSYEVEFDASSLSSGVYSYKIQAGNFIETKKMILLK
jgi:hypothetical protein